MYVCAWQTYGECACVGAQDGEDTGGARALHVEGGAGHQVLLHQTARPQRVVVHLQKIHIHARAGKVSVQ
jgi:hypothetical protein